MPHGNAVAAAVHVDTYRGGVVSAWSRDRVQHETRAPASSCPVLELLVGEH